MSETPDYVEDRDPGQSSVAEGFLRGNERAAAHVKKKFEVAYFVAKEELAFLKYPAILNLEEMQHGVDVGQAYHNDKNCAEFIHYIGKDFHNNILQKSKTVNFYNI